MWIFLVACFHGDDERYGMYKGFLREADLDKGIDVVDDASSFTLELEPSNDGVVGIATLRGETIGPLGTFEGKEVDEVRNIRIDGDELRCSYKNSGVGLKVKGLFADNFASLVLDVEFIGVIYMDRVTEDSVEYVNADQGIEHID